MRERRFTTANRRRREDDRSGWRLAQEILRNFRQTVLIDRRLLFQNHQRARSVVAQARRILLRAQNFRAKLCGDDIFVLGVLAHHNRNRDFGRDVMSDGDGAVKLWQESWVNFHPRPSGIAHCGSSPVRCSATVTVRSTSRRCVAVILTVISESRVASTRRRRGSSVVRVTRARRWLAEIWGAWSD